MNGFASCFLVCKQLWFKGRGGRGATCDLWLVPLHYIPIVIYFLHVVSCVNRPMTTKPTYNHNYINYNQHHPPPPSSSTCAAWHRGCGCPWKPPVPSGCRDLLMAIWVRKQRSNSRTRALSVRDDEEGHLICRSGDVLQERCTHCHYSIVTLLHMSIMHRAFTWHGSAWWWWCLARMLFALADIAGWIARKLEILRGMLEPSPFCSTILSCGAFSMFHRLLDFPK